MAISYKLKYFNFKAVAEPIRLIFACAGVPFEDIRIERDSWVNEKPKCPWGTVPVLEVDGKEIGQSKAIIRFLGKRFDLAGETEFDSARCDELIESLDDFKQACRETIREDDKSDRKKEMVAKLVAETFPKFLGKWNEILVQNPAGWFVGNKISYADICIGCVLQIYNSNLASGKAFTDYPALGAHQAAVFNTAGIKEWVAKRPVTTW